MMNVQLGVLSLNQWDELGVSRRAGKDEPTGHQSRRVGLIHGFALLRPQWDVFRGFWPYCKGWDA
ncbi:hypothetical protein [Pontibacter sp. G13]|uniref:hypothetical protein n=1 Tax=Pontibacter sp. G13 TaxID=3074898 RepID=UPI002889DECF|nr:hypothetical protein [Pontibacter sp. G13]WNJ19816.1 hypothetical protein RJD25_04975 [Pontibacter sp. G13]